MRLGDRPAHPRSAGQEAGRFRHRRGPRRSRIRSVPAALCCRSLSGPIRRRGRLRRRPSPPRPPGLETRRDRLDRLQPGQFRFFSAARALLSPDRVLPLARYRGGPAGLPRFPSLSGSRSRGSGSSTVGGGRFRRKIGRVSRPLRSEWEFRGLAGLSRLLWARGFQGRSPGDPGQNGDGAPARARPCSATGITTLQHAELWRDALTRFMSEKARGRAAGLDQDHRRMAVRRPRRPPGRT